MFSVSFLNTLSLKVNHVISLFTLLTHSQEGLQKAHKTYYVKKKYAWISNVFASNNHLLIPVSWFKNPYLSEKWRKRVLETARVRARKREILLLAAGSLPKGPSQAESEPDRSKEPAAPSRSPMWVAHLLTPLGRCHQQGGKWSTFIHTVCIWVLCKKKTKHAWNSVDLQGQS